MSDALPPGTILAIQRLHDEHGRAAVRLGELLADLDAGVLVDRVEFSEAICEVQRLNAQAQEWVMA